MAAIKAAKATIKTAKGRLARFHNYVEQFVEADGDFDELNVYVTKYGDAESEYEEACAQLSSLEEPSEETVTAQDRLVARHLKLFARAQRMLRIHSKEARKSELLVDSLLAPINNVKLPQLNLPVFSGKYEDWLEFRDSFKSLIDDKIDLDDVQKFRYLKSVLRGDALNMISGLLLTNDNYGVAWDMLNDRYHKKHILIYNHTKSLLNIPHIKSNSSDSILSTIDLINKNTRALKNLNVPVDHWDVILSVIVSEKLDSRLLCEFDEYIDNKELTIGNMLSFLNKKSDHLTKLSLTTDTHKNAQVKGYKTDFKRHANMCVSEGFRGKCYICNESHAIINCANFINVDPRKRFNLVKSKSLCVNCLRPGHGVSFCRSRGCTKCNHKHHTLLHFARDAPVVPGETEQVVVTQNSLASQFADDKQEVLLSTAIVLLADAKGTLIPCKALLDSGSQPNFISNNLVQRLGLNKMPNRTAVVGINNAPSHMRHSCCVTICSRLNTFKTKLHCLVIPKITGTIPTKNIDIKKFNLPNNLSLADPSFYIPSEIDLLIGSALFWQILDSGSMQLGNNSPLLHNTLFGWVIAGPVGEGADNESEFCGFIKNDSESYLQGQVTKFWESEELQSDHIFSAEESACESYYQQTFQRDSTGRFIVSIPFKHSPKLLGSTRQQALNMLYKLERKFVFNAEFKLLYHDFIHEYIKLGHMTQLTEDPNTPNFYLPHHGVLKEESTTTKLRVVFNASMPSTSGWSLNSLQMIGPTIQSDLVSILIRFRHYKYIVSGDIEKMYRQIFVEPSQRQFQLVLWRDNPTDPVKTFKLNTITYGTASAPFLAIRCLNQLAIETKSDFPEISRMIDRDFYVDDLLTGSDSLLELKSNITRLINILHSSGFSLRKLLSNEPALLSNNNNNNNINDNLLITDAFQPTKHLGLIWNHTQDTLKYKFKLIDSSTITNKRAVLSQIAQIFDPLGLLSPVVIKAKMFMQYLWQFKLSWDEPLPSDLLQQWYVFYNKLISLNDIVVPRNAIQFVGDRVIELHGFCDASQEAYGACVYIKCMHGSNVSVKLLTAKSRVAPLKSITVPRLELCGALLLAKLVEKIQRSICVQYTRYILWTDSTIVLNWLTTAPNLLKTFVSNRVSEIQQLTKSFNWRHVPTGDNPADLISRGIQPDKLCHCDLWWSGPSWLSKEPHNWPVNLVKDVVLPDVKPIKKFVFITLDKEGFNLLEKFSSLNKLKRVTALCLRFIYNCRAKTVERKYGPIDPCDLNGALFRLARMEQLELCPQDYNYLLHHGFCHRKSKFLSLTPFMDELGVVRVGGRLQNSNYSFSKKHPILLPPGSLLAKLVFTHEHIRNLHCGATALLATVRDFWWPIAGRQLAKQTVRQCMICFRHVAQGLTPLMASLPKYRISQSPPFSNCGVDYAGPIKIKHKSGRGGKILKAYLCIFVCFATKAVHLEVVSDLTSESFLSALRRFTSRRGIPINVYSDNGTNFVGAQRELREIYEFLEKSNTLITASLANDNIKWHFIPASAPHFGGLWEAGVKSMKYHLKRIMANLIFTFEELNTVVVQIECVLNSRPLSAVSTNATDFAPLTPAHFLIGRPLNSLPDVNLTETPSNRLSRWQHMQQILQHFWQRWSKEYISELQTRSKWKTVQGNICKDALVLIKDDNLPPTSWKLGRILEVHPGTDNTVRVASVKTAQGVCKRPVRKLCPLPMDV